MSQKEARDNLLKSKIGRKSYYDKYVNPVKYNINDLVLVKNETGNKLDALYSGPYKVIKIMPPNVEIMKNGKIDVIHMNRTKLYHT